MIRILVFAASLIFACLIAGVYGAAHDQISYSVSEEYFSHLKFHQFRIAPELHGRIGAAIVGWNASWWMGLILGTPIGLVCLWMPSIRLQTFAFLKVSVLVICLTLLIGISSLFIDVPQAYVELIRIPPGVTNPGAFAKVGLLHEAGYLGGMISMIICMIVLIIWVRRERAT